jgi:hypothetical protein
MLVRVGILNLIFELLVNLKKGSNLKEEEWKIRIGQSMNVEDAYEIEGYNNSLELIFDLIFNIIFENRINQQFATGFLPIL